MKSYMTLLCIMFLWGCAASGQSIRDLMDSFTREYYILNPDAALEKGIDPRFGIDVPDVFTDTSPTGMEKEYALIAEYTTRLNAIDRSKLSKADTLHYDVFKKYLSFRTEEKKYAYHAYVISPMFSCHSSMVTAMTAQLRLNTGTDAERFLKRLEQFPVRLSQEKEKLMVQVKKGILPSKGIIDAYSAPMESFIKDQPNTNILNSYFKTKITAMNLTDVEKKDLQQRCEKILADSVYPAYQDYIAYVKSVKEKAPDTIGVWQLPDGKKYYDFCLRYNLTSDISAQKIHKIGLKETQRLQGEIVALIVELGIEKQETFGKTINAYWDYCTQKEPGLQYPNTQAGKDQTIKDYRSIIETTEKRLPELFSLLPKVKVTVEPVPKFKEKTAGTYYQPAPLDGSSPGVFFANLGYQHYKPDMASLTFHEAIPGHHLQFAIQQDIGLPLFYTIPFFTAYIEGWAMYAEQIAYEQKWFSDVHSRISYLSSALFRAVRMTVDTGIHTQKWTTDQAYKYMVDNVGWGSYGEVGRYAIWPGQACAYMFGKMTFLELRAKAQKELGSKFDIKEFHTAVLENGTLPFSLVERQVDEYIKNN